MSVRARTIAAAALTAAALSGCAIVTFETKVPPEQLALRLPENRDGVLVEGDLVRVTWDGAGSMHVVASRVGEDGKPVLSFSGALGRYRGGGLVGNDEFLAAEARSRAASAFHAPVQAAGAANLWVVHDAIPVFQNGVPKRLLTLEAYPVDPRPVWAQGKLLRPARVWAIGERGVDGKELWVDSTKRIFLSWNGAFLRPARFERGPDQRLVACALEPWTPEIGVVLGGATAESVLQPSEVGPDNSLRAERLLNDFLVEWKTRKLVEWARGATVAQLEDSIVAAEKGMLELDRRGRVLKDQIDAKARDGAGNQPVLTETAQLLDQRRTLIGVVVTTMKQARAAKAQQAFLAPASAPAR